MTKKLTQGTSGGDYGNDLEALAHDILKKVSKKSIATEMSLPLSRARATYVMTSITVASEEDFFEEVTRFYRHVSNVTGRIPADTDNRSELSEARAILEKAFAESGGVTSACSEGLHGTCGGMRFVFDAMIEQMAKDMMEEYVTTTLRQVIEPLDWATRQDLIHRIVTKFDCLGRDANDA